MRREPGAPVSALMCSDRRLSCSRRPSAAGTLVSLLEFSDLRARASYASWGHVLMSQPSSASGLQNKTEHGVSEVGPHTELATLCCKGWLH